jgi:hypothetical protein
MAAIIHCIIFFIVYCLFLNFRHEAGRLKSSGPQVQLMVMLGDVVHQRPSVVAQSRAITHDSLCVVSYLHHVNLGANIQKKKEKPK